MTLLMKKTAETTEREQYDAKADALIRLWHTLRPSNWVLALAFVLLIGIAATEPIFPYLLKPIIDDGFQLHPPPWVRWIPVFIIALFVVRGTLTFCSNYLGTWINQNALSLLRQRLYAHLLRLPDATFKQERSAEILVKFTLDTQNALGGAIELVTGVVRDTAVVLALLAALLWINWQLSIIALVIVPLSAWVSRLLAKRLTQLARDAQASNADLTQNVQETVAAQRVIKLHHAYAQAESRFAALAQKLRRLAMRGTAAQAAAMPATQILSAIGVALVVALSMSHSAVASGFSGGDFIAFITTMLLLLAPLKNLSNASAVAARTRAAAESVFAFLDQAQELDAKINPALTQTAIVTAKVAANVTENDAANKAALAVRFDQITFQYPNALIPALSEFNLVLPAGKTVALVGRSGSGKSTLAALLPRFILAQLGQITINGMDTAAMPLADIRAQMAMVTQDTVLFDDTVAFNVSYGCTVSHHADKIWAALTLAHLAEHVRSLPLGIDTPIGEGGNTLSGGQKQRLAIARAFYKNAPILILDEATSALDNESEAHIQNALKTLAAGRTTLVIAHRLSTVMHADNIVVMDAGRILEQGTHVQLLAKGGAYAALYNQTNQIN